MLGEAQLGGAPELYVSDVGLLGFERCTNIAVPIGKKCHLDGTIEEDILRVLDGTIKEDIFLQWQQEDKIDLEVDK